MSTDSLSFYLLRAPVTIAAMQNIFTMVLAGGRGERLHPLTEHRAKPAVPFGGKYRIIDFTLSNCLNSGLRKVAVLIQYKSHSLDRHIRTGWDVYNAELGEFIASIPPQQRISEEWYRGTADAVYQNLFLLESAQPEYVLILAGDHIYKMNYLEMFHWMAAKSPDVVVGAPNSPFPAIRRECQAAADQARIHISFIEVVDPNEYDQALARAKRDGAGGMIVALNALTYTHRAQLAQLGLKHRFPGIFWDRSYVENGGLMSYGANLHDVGGALRITWTGCWRAPNLPTCPSSNPRNSICSSISRPRVCSAVPFRSHCCCVQLESSSKRTEFGRSAVWRG